MQSQCVSQERLQSLDLRPTRRYMLVGMKISEAARRSDLEASAIRFYETAEILPGPARTTSGYRDYDEDDVELLRFVRRLRVLELPLDDIREIVGLRIRGEAPCRPVRDAIDREAVAIDVRIEELRRLRGELERLQGEAALVTDEWPVSCVCHVVAATESRRSS